MVIKTAAVAENVAVSGSRGRPKINYEQMPARFPEGTFARMDTVLTPTETRTDLIRDSVEAMIISRERQAERKRAAEAAKAERERQKLADERRAKREAKKAAKAAQAAE